MGIPLGGLFAGGTGSDLVNGLAGGGTFDGGNSLQQGGVYQNLLKGQKMSQQQQLLQQQQQQQSGMNSQQIAQALAGRGY